MSESEQFMQRCLELAEKGMGKVAPNPMVGAVIVYKGNIIGEGYHQEYGTAHAEVNAINSVRDKTLLKDSTLYVNLEPCSHQGKTPPCADLIISMGIKYVVIGTVDPNPLVQGRGIQKLITSGCDLKIGIMEKECRELNIRFFTFYEKMRPYIILKWAQTQDKFIGVQGEKVLITNSEVNKLVHQWRREEQAIMVGTNTALEDNPQLTVRYGSGKNPIRIVLDRIGKLTGEYYLLDGTTPTLIFTETEKKSRNNVEYISLSFNDNLLEQIMRVLYERKILSIIVEGGAHLINSLIGFGLWDEIRVLTSTKSLINQTKKEFCVAAPVIQGKLKSERTITNNLVQVFRNTD